MTSKDEKVRIEKLEGDERARQLARTLEGEGCEESEESPEHGFTPRFPASGSKNWIPVG